MAQEICDEFLPLNTVFDSSYSTFLLFSDAFVLIRYDAVLASSPVSAHLVMFAYQLHLLKELGVQLMYYLHILDFSSKYVTLLTNFPFNTFYDHNTNKLKLLLTSSELTKQTCIYTCFLVPVGRNPEKMHTLCIHICICTNQLQLQ